MYCERVRQAIGFTGVDGSSTACYIDLSAWSLVAADTVTQVIDVTSSLPVAEYDASANCQWEFVMRSDVPYLKVNINLSGKTIDIMWVDADGDLNTSNG
jgi:hypothetical protein